MKIDYERLKRISLDKDNKSKKLLDESETATFLIELWSKMLYKMNAFTISELAQFINSIQHWLVSKDRKMTVDYKPGTIAEIEFGIKYSKETAYRHIGLILENFNSTVVVIPCTSSPKYVNKAIENPEKWNYLLVGEKDGFDRKQCVLILSEIQTISKSRIIAKYNNLAETEEGKILFKNIKDTMVRKYFSKQVQELETQIKQLEEKLDSKVRKSNDEIITLCQCVQRQERIINELKDENNELREKIDRKSKKIGSLYWKLNKLNTKAEIKY